jgi:hypothetical protein
MGAIIMGMGIGVQEGIELKPVPGLEGKYSAGSDGHIYCYSTAKVNARKPVPFMVAEAIGSAGYPFVAICGSGRKRTKAVHTLVCLAFHGPKPSPVHETRHLDGSRANNAPLNLCWGTGAENEQDKRRHGRVAEGSRHGIAKLNEEAVRILRVAIPQGLWNPIDAAKVFGVDPSVIRAAVNGKNWKHVE